MDESECCSARLDAREELFKFRDRRLNVLERDLGPRRSLKEPASWSRVALFVTSPRLSHQPCRTLRPSLRSFHPWADDRQPANQRGWLHCRAVRYPTDGYTRCSGRRAGSRHGWYSNRLQGLQILHAPEQRRVLEDCHPELHRWSSRTRSRPTIAVLISCTGFSERQS